MDQQRLNYTMIRFYQRMIRKFKIRGTDYRLRVDAVPDGTDYDTAVFLVMNVIERKCFLKWLLLLLLLLSVLLLSLF